MADERSEMIKQLASYSHVGMTFVFSILIGFGIGWFIDNKLLAGKTSPVFTFIFLGLGIAAGFKNLWDLIKQLEDK